MDLDKNSLGLRELLAAASVVVAVIAQFFVQAFPTEYQTSIRIGFLLLFVTGLIAGLAFYLTRFYAREKVTRDALATIMTQRPGPGPGIHSIVIRNVRLRVETLHLLIDGIARQVEKNQRQKVLYSIGEQVGKTWASTLEALSLARSQIEGKDLGFPDKLELWSLYDKDAGVGQFSFEELPRNGFGDIYLEGSFMAQHDSTCECDLDWVTAGYIAGTLSGLLGGKGIEAKVVNPSTQKKHDRSVFVTSRPAKL